MRGWVGKRINYKVCMSRRRWGQWGLLSVLLRGGLVTVGVCVVQWKISSYWLDKTGVSCVLVYCTEIVSICNENVTFHMRRRDRRRVWLGESVKMCVVLLTELSWEGTCTLYYILLLYFTTVIVSVGDPTMPSTFFVLIYTTRA